MTRTPIVTYNQRRSPPTRKTWLMGRCRQYRYLAHIFRFCYKDREYNSLTRHEICYAYHINITDVLGAKSVSSQKSGEAEAFPGSCRPYPGIAQCKPGKNPLYPLFGPFPPDF